MLLSCQLAVLEVCQLAVLRLCQLAVRVLAVPVPHPLVITSLHARVLLADFLFYCCSLQRENLGCFKK